MANQRVHLGGDMKRGGMCQNKHFSMRDELIIRNPR
jgi:hypothetical protein